jgi:hypothetical protein
MSTQSSPMPLKTWSDTLQLASLIYFFNPLQNVLAPSISITCVLDLAFSKVFSKGYVSSLGPNAYARSYFTLRHLDNRFYFEFPLFIIRLSILNPITHSITSWLAKQKTYFIPLPWVHRVCFSLSYFPNVEHLPIWPPPGRKPTYLIPNTYSRWLVH